MSIPDRITPDDVDLDVEPAEHPRSAPGIVGGIVVTIATAIVVRYVLGILLADSIQPVTFWAVLGGGLGAVVMYAVAAAVELPRLPTVRFWASVIGDDDPEKYVRPATWLHVVTGAIVGGFHPRIYHNWVGLGGAEFAQFPAAVPLGIIYGLVVFLFTVVLVVFDVVEMDTSPDNVAWLFVLFLSYGLTIGITLGFWRGIVRPILGV